MEKLINRFRIIERSRWEHRPRILVRAKTIIKLATRKKIKAKRDK